MARVRLLDIVLLAAWLVLAGSALAAEPDAPQLLVQDLVGVTGSGDQLSLYLRESGTLRRIKPGEAYAQGWTLKSLTASEATLEKDGETRRIGLNPTGALASAQSGAASQVQVLGWSDADLLARLLARGVWDGVKLRDGLNLEETRRWWILNERFEVKLADFMAPYYAEAAAAGRPRPTVSVTNNDLLAAMGPAGGREYLELTNRGALARLEQAQAIYDQHGPVKITATTADFMAFVAVNRSGPLAQFGPNALWKLDQRMPDGTMVEVLSAPGPADDHTTPLSAADNPGPFNPTVRTMTAPPTTISVGGLNVGVPPGARPGAAP